MKLILTSDGISSAAIEKKLMELLDGSPAAVKACIITTASSKKDRSATAIKTKELFQSSGFVRADFVDIELDNPETLREYDVIYINGGNPFYLLLQLKRTGCVHLLRQLAAQGKLLVGTSAGAMVLADSIAHVNELNVICRYEPMDLEQLRDYDAVGLTRIAILPHYNRFMEVNPDFEEELRQLEKRRGIRLVRVGDGEAVAIDGETVTFVKNE